jgi:hypothetical protein
MNATVSAEISYIENLGHYKHWFFFTLLYIVIDYGRPQDILSIGFLRPGMIAILILTAFIFLSGRIKEADSKQTRMIGLFIVLLGLFVPFARNNFFAYETTLNMLLFVPFILSVIICVNSIERLKKLIFVLILLMIYISVYSFLHHGIGSGNYFADENDVSLYINMWLPFCFFLFFAEKDRLRRIIYGLGLVIGIMAVIVSFSRGGFIGLISCAVISWLFSPGKTRSLVILCLLGLVFYVYADNLHSDPSRKGGRSYWEEMATTTDTLEGTGADRIESWKAGWRMFLDHPVGVGGNNFPVWFPDYQSVYFRKGMWGRVAHSLWFTLIPELGIFGIAIYLLLLFFNLADLFFINKLNESDHPDFLYLKLLSRAFLGSFVGFFVSGTFLSVLYYPHYWYLTGIIVAMRKVSQKLLLPQSSDRIAT